MSHKISIIMPCYNCSSTLEEAVASIYKQNFSLPYEVVMVNDGSTDSTEEVIKKLAKEYPNISHYSHDKNRGGGAARNSAITKITGNIIYCLDGDNILAPNSLQKMADFLIENNYDGVSFYERRFFKGKNTKKFNSYFNKNKKQITLRNLFDDSNTLLDNFMYTKESYLKTEGYPEHHGFDTQCFEIRYLSTGNSVFVCPNTIFYHRQGNEKSYFERVYESGDFSKNLYFIYEDIIHLFSDKLVEQLMLFDIFQNSKISTSHIATITKKYFADKPKEFFIKNYNEFITKNGIDAYHKKYPDLKTKSDIFKKAIHYYKNKNYQESLNLLNQLLNNGFESKIIYFNILRCSIGLSRKHKTSNIEKDSQDLIESLLPKKQNLNLNPNLIEKIFRKIFN